ncbi:MAG TPA: hypothetical protein VHW73_13565 [Rudaea sp.]|jgi:hypothetical protein|nr:hypothetical protein [Rudaea sp.]
MRFRHLACHVFLCGLASSFAQNANAICSPLINYERVVGDTANDKNCTDNDIQSAINNAVCPNTTIYITGEHLYKSQHLLIQDKSLSLVGTSSATCNIGVGNNLLDTTPTAPLITLSGAGHSGDSVISIHGNSHVTLQYLEVTGGASDTDQFGGGVYFGGQGALTLDTDTIDNNFAGYGGGINAFGEGGALTITIKQNTLILDNRAQFNGGGIRIEGSTHLYMLEDGSSVAFNQAEGLDQNNQPSGGEGGGIAIYGPAIADIASPGTLVGTVSENSATYGGGIAAIGTSSGRAIARLFSVSSTRPVLLEQNRASASGGAVYVEPKDDSINAILCAGNFRFALNTAPSGAAIFGAIESASGGFIFLNAFDKDDSCLSADVTALGGVNCTQGVECNDFYQNSAIDESNAITQGAIIEGNGSDVTANRISMRQNNAHNLVHFIDSVESIFNTCRLTDNHSTSALIDVAGSKDNSVTGLSSSTIAGNQIDSGPVIVANCELVLTRMLVYQPTVRSVNFSQECVAGSYSASDTITTDISNFPANSTNILQSDTPRFVDATNADPDKRDYHLTAFAQAGLVTASPAIDFGSSANGSDLDRNPYNVDVPLVSNGAGPRDVGAYEAQPITDRIFGDAFGDAISLLR